MGEAFLGSNSARHPALCVELSYCFYRVFIQMKLNITLTKTNIYSEVGQHNPLRWKILFQEKDGSFVDQSGWMKCKDFFNDVVAYFQKGTKFSIYSFQNAIKDNDGGVYMLLKYVKPKFLENIAMVNKQMKADIGCEIWAVPRDDVNDEVVIFLPKECWASTYTISLVTFVIRLCNYGMEFSKWEDLWSKDSPSKKFEHAFTEQAIQNAEKWGFKVPGKYDKYWYYAGEVYNSEVKPEITGSLLHNNGCSNWAAFMGIVK